ncbi:MAG TPA: hypothetical protein VH575_12000 [Gemmataceae bacterium]|jgi:hypothetical protein
MTEAEWNNADNPQVMLNWLREQGKLSDRKARLFAVACCRRIWRLLKDEVSRMAVQVAEAFADGFLSDDASRSAEERAETVRSTAQSLYDREVDDSTYARDDEVIAAGWKLLTAVDAAVAAKAAVSSSAEDAAHEASRAASTAQEWDVQAARWSEGRGRRLENDFDFSERAIQVTLLRDIFGNPFRTLRSLAPSLLTPTIIGLAQTIYEQRSFERMRELADALEEAGCDNEEILGHLRQQGQVHVRGCWVIDSLLNKN